MSLRWSKPRAFRILDFDLENRPLSYAGSDWTTAEITAIAAGWADKPAVACWLLGRDDPEVMLEEFLALYEEADMVTGHYIRKHDLPILNGALLEYGFEPLSAKLTCDTRLDLVKKKDMAASQKDLAKMYGVKAPKVDMAQPDWREANRLLPSGLEKSYKRVVGDVRQHKALRLKMLEFGALKAPSVWRP